MVSHAEAGDGRTDLAMVLVCPASEVPVALDAQGHVRHHGHGVPGLRAGHGGMDRSEFGSAMMCHVVP